MRSANTTVSCPTQWVAPVKCHSCAAALDESRKGGIGFGSSPSRHSSALSSRVYTERTTRHRRCYRRRRRRIRRRRKRLQPSQLLVLTLGFETALRFPHTLKGKEDGSLDRALPLCPCDCPYETVSLYAVQLRCCVRCVDV